MTSKFPPSKSDPEPAEQRRPDPEPAAAPKRGKPRGLEGEEVARIAASIREAWERQASGMTTDSASRVWRYGPDYGSGVALRVALGDNDKAVEHVTQQSLGITASEYLLNTVERLDLLVRDLDNA